MFLSSSTSVLWCKLRQYFGHVSSLTSLFSTAWAMIDQYLSHRLVLITSNIVYRSYIGYAFNFYIYIISFVEIAIAICFLTTRHLEIYLDEDNQRIQRWSPAVATITSFLIDSGKRKDKISIISYCIQLQLKKF